MKRRLRRFREKSRMAATSWDEVIDDDVDVEDDGVGVDDVDDETATDQLSTTSKTNLSDELEYLGAIRCAAKIKGFAFSPMLSGKKTSLVETALVTLVNNSMEMYSVPTTVPSDGPWMSTKTAVIDLHGHRYTLIFVCLLL